MNKVMQKIKEWFKEWQKRHQAALSAKLIHEAYEHIQIKEFGGQGYIAIDGIAYIRVSDLKEDVYEVLKKARIDYATQCSIGKA